MKDYEKEQLIAELERLRQENESLKKIVAERQQIEEALRESESRLRTLLSHAPVVLAALDREGVFTLSEGKGLEALGLKPGEIVGQSLFDLYSDVPGIREYWQRALSGESFSVIVPIRELVFKTWTSPIQDQSGELTGVITVAMDITEQAQMEAALRENEARSNALLSALPDLIFLLSKEGVYLDYHATNPQDLWAPPNEFLGKNIHEIMPPPLAQSLAQLFEQALQTGESQVLEYSLPMSNGTRHYEARIAACGEDKLFSIVRDITDQKRLEEQLFQAQKMESVGRLAGGVAHDFNNLLTAIIGYAELAETKLTPDHPVRGDLQQILRAAERAANLIRQLLAFARRQALEPKTINLNELILNMHQMLHRLIGEDIELVILPATSLGHVKADPTQMEQVLTNLVINARDAMPYGGKLVIETANVDLDAEYARQHAEVIPGEYVMLAVSDTGIGMTEEVKMHIFEPFFTTKEGGRGTGLGLATCYGIVKQLGGHIWLYTEPDRGTTFKIYLPRTEPTTVTPSMHEQPGNLPQGTETILLVEDEPLVRKIALKALEERGYTVLAASNGEEALRLAAADGRAIHLLVTDVVMPRMGGLELAQRLTVTRPEMKVLYVSGYTDNAIVHHELLEAGVEFLQKPFTAAVLTHKVREVLDA